MEDTSTSVISSTPHSSRPCASGLQLGCPTCGTCFVHQIVCLSKENKAVDLKKTKAPKIDCLGMKAVDLKKTNSPRHGKSERRDSKSDLKCGTCYSFFATFEDYDDHSDDCFRNRHINHLRNKMKAVALYDSKSNAPQRQIPKVGDDDDKDEDTTPLWLQSGYYGKRARALAESAIFIFNDDKKYKLVEPGPYGQTLISGGPIYHLNFKAKAQNCPNAQVETFFVQMRFHHSVGVVDCWVSLGPSHELPCWEEPEQCNGDCYYCRGALIHHPAERPDKLITQEEGDEADWLYGPTAHPSSDSE